jgi:hypothetical protein
MKKTFLFFLKMINNVFKNLNTRLNELKLNKNENIILII